MRQGEKKDQGAKNRSTQLSALRHASAANGNHDKDRDNALGLPLEVLPMKQRKSGTQISHPPPGCTLTPSNNEGYGDLCYRSSTPSTYFSWARRELMVCSRVFEKKKDESGVSREYKMKACRLESCAHAHQSSVRYQCKIKLAARTGAYVHIYILKRHVPCTYFQQALFEVSSVRALLE